MSSTRVRELEDRRTAAVLVLLVLAAGCLALAVADPAGTSVVTWWPAVGVAALTTTVTPRAWWWWLLPALTGANFSANVLFGRPWDFALVLSVAVAAESAVFATVMRHRPGGRAALDSQLDFLRLVLASGCAALLGGLMAGTLLPAIAGAGTLRDHVSTIPPSHATAMLVVAPVVMSLRRPLLPVRGWELATQSCLLAGTALMAFWFSDALAMTFVPLPFLAWAAFKFGLRVVAWQLAAVALLVTVATALRRGPFAVGSAGDEEALLTATSLVQVFLLCLALICVPLAVNVEQGVRLTERLRASSDLFRRNFSESLVAMLVLRAGDDGLEVFDANQVTADLLGCEPDALVGRLLQDLVVTDTPLAHVSARMAGGELDVWRDEGTLPQRPGSRVALSIARLSRPEDEELLFSAQLLDLTAERAARASLAAERQLSDMTLATTACLILVTDVDGVVLRANPAVTRLLGQPEEALVGNKVWDVLVPPEHRQIAMSMFEQPGGAAIPRNVESTLHDTRGGEHRIAWTSGVVDAAGGFGAYVVMTGLDITAERNAAGLMRHVLQAALGTALIGVDTRGMVSLFNTGAEGLLGRGSADVVGTPFTDLLDQAELREWARRHEVSATFDGLVDRLVDQPAEDWTWQRPDDRRPVVSMSLSRVTDHSGTVIGYLCVGTDITEARHTQELLVKALDKERQVVERLRDLDAAKDEFVSTVSHELRTPVSTIVGYTELLRDGDFGDVSPEQSPVLEAINRNGERLVSLVDNLLALSGLATDSLTWDRQRIDLRDVVTAARDRVAGPLAQRRLEVSFGLPDEPVVVEGDRAQLDRVLSNLLSNAVKFTEDGGQVSCRLQCADGEASLVVMDTGLGIPREEQDNLFDRFWRSSTSQTRHIQGTGLGLSIVQAVVSAHGGTVAIESEHLEGTTVQVRLPLHRERTRRVTATL